MTSAADFYFDPASFHQSVHHLSSAAPTSGSIVVAYQGEPGAYSEAAIRQLFKNTSVQVQPLPCTSFSAVFQCLTTQQASYVLVPIENSLGGSIHDNYDLLLRHKVTCVAELQFKVSHCLVALPGVKLSDIKTAYSHPQALAQCEGYLSRIGVVPEKQYDTAGSAKIIAERGLKDVAAIASELAAQTYGLEILARKIEDDDSNYTRFLLLTPSTYEIEQAIMYAGGAGASVATTGAAASSASSSASNKPSITDNVAHLPFSPSLVRTTFKTSLVFTLPDSPGTLFKALSVFALRDMHLCKIESRPCKDMNFLADVQKELEVFQRKDSAGSDVRDARALSVVSEGPPSTDSTVTSPTSDVTAPNFKYIFFLDTLSSLNQNESLKNALRHLREYAPFLRILGSYPVFQAGMSSGSSKSKPKPAPVVRADGTLAPPGGHSRNPSAAGHSRAGSAAFNSPPPITQLRIGVIGFGTFGQFLCKTFRKQGHTLYAHSRSDYSSLSAQYGVEWCHSPEDLCAKKLDVLIFSVSILSFESTVESFPWTKLSDCLLVDVLSVKEHPKRLLLSVLEKYPQQKLDLLCTHPMFGPESGKLSWNGLPFMYEAVSVKENPQRSQDFLSSFSREGCRMLAMSCSEHDTYAAGSQFLTHTTGRILARLGCTSTPINTQGFNKLLQVIEQTQKDSWELYAGLYKYNKESHEQLKEFEKVFVELKKKLEEMNQKEESKSSSSSASSSSSTTLFNPLPLRMNESRTAAMADLTKKLSSQGIDVTSLSVGEVLSTKTPQSIIDAAVKAMQEGKTTYTSTNGVLELRQGIAAKLQKENQLTYTPEQILVTNGAKQAIYQSLLACIVPGVKDEVIIPAPYWVSYPDMVTLVGGKPVIVDTAADAYILTPQKLRSAITSKTRMIILCSPSNPTGIVYTRAQLQALADVVAEFPDLLVLSDEIYEYLLFDGTSHTSFASLPNMLSRTLTINGFSKGHVMTGFRVGYLAGPLDIVKMANKVQGQITSCASSVSQWAALAGLALPHSFREGLVRTLDVTRQMLLTELSAIPQVSFQKPNSAFYVLVDVSKYYGKKTKEGQVVKDSDDLAMYLLNSHRVALVAGSAFGAPQCLRISYASSDALVQKGVKALAAGLKELQ